ncbi:MAG: hypothetical protein V4629_12230, partial [Pseudomonadota bacterium]
MGWRDWFRNSNFIKKTSKFSNQLVPSVSHSAPASKLQSYLFQLQQTRSALEVQVHNLPAKRNYQT